MKAAIIGSGMVDNYTAFTEEVKKCDIVICADGGITHLINTNIPPDVFIGDFDSSNAIEIKNHSIVSATKFIEHNPVKDDTDMQLCIDYAIENGCNEIVMFAALGGRIDHELSNIFHLKYMLDRGVVGKIFSYSNRIMIANNYIKVDKEDGFKISVVPVTEKVTGVTLKGLRYSLRDAEIVQGTSLGISNEFTGDCAEIYVENGTLLIIVSKD